MSNRKDIKNQHESYVITEFVKHLTNTTGKEYRLISRPEPPDAILQCDDLMLWVEVADIFRNPDEAHEIYSLVTPDEDKYTHREHPIMEPDKRLACKLLDVLMKKVSKKSYEETTNLYRRGILILNENDPLFSASTLHEIEDLIKDAKTDLDIQSKYFNSVYLSYRNLRSLVFQKLLELPIRLS